MHKLTEADQNKTHQTLDPSSQATQVNMIHALHDYAAAPGSDNQGEVPVHKVDSEKSQDALTLEEEGQHFQDQWQSLWEEHYQVQLYCLNFWVPILNNEYKRHVMLWCQLGVTF